MIFHRSLAVLVIVFCNQVSVPAQTICGQGNSFLLPPARTFCVGDDNIARISFNLINQGDPGSYTVAFPDGSDTSYVGIVDALEITYDLAFTCDNPPGGPQLPQPGAEFYAYRGQLTITRTDCIDEDQKYQIGTYPFNIIPNPIKDIEVKGSLCGEAPYSIDFSAKLCDSELVNTYQWYVDDRPVIAASGTQLHNFPIESPGEHSVRLETTTFSDKCESFTFERTFVLSGVPEIELNYVVDSSTLCSPMVTITTETQSKNATSFQWSSNSRDVSFSDPTIPNPVITIVNDRPGTRTISLAANNDNCNSVSTSFEVTTYSEQEIRMLEPLRTCVGAPFTLCERLEYQPTPQTIQWTTRDPLTISQSNTTCPELIFPSEGNYEVTASGVSLCGTPFTKTFSVSVRNDEPLRFNFSSVDTLCPSGGPVNLLDHINNPESVSHFSGSGISGTTFDPQHLSGQVLLSVTDGCGTIYPIDIFVPAEEIYSGGDLSVCEGESIDLTALQAGDYAGVGVIGGVFSSTGLPVGEHTIHFSSRDFCGGETSLTVRVAPKPMAAFDIVSTACLGGDAGAATPVAEPVNLVNRSTARVICYSILETGNSVCGKNEATFVLPEAGTYTLQQIVANSSGNCTDTLRRIIEALPSFEPDFYFNIDSTQCDTVLLSFLNRGSSNGGNFSWTFSNGVTIDQENPTLLIPRPDNGKPLHAMVVATDQCVTVRDTFQLILPRKFRVSFGILNDNNTVCSGDTAFLINHSSNAQDFVVTLPGGRTVDSLPKELVVFNHSQDILSYIIRLDGSNPACPDKSAVDTLYVAPAKTEAAFNLTYDDSCSPVEVQLINHSTTGSMGRISWGDHTTFQRVASHDTVRHEYRVARDTTFTISLQAQLCGTDIFATRFAVRARPNASFRTDSPAGSCIQQTVEFTPVAVEEGSSMEWNFGDGRGSLASRPQHAYDSAGTYRVFLEVTNVNGCYAIDSMDLPIREYSGPPLRISLPPSICVDAPLKIGSTGSGPNLSYDYGNNLRSDAPISRPYQAEGEYKLTVTGTDEYGCSTDTSGFIRVHPRFTVEIVPDKEIMVELGSALELAFDMNPSRNLDSIRWEGDAVSNPYSHSTQVLPYEDGVYRLSVTDEFGCLATDSLRVGVRKSYASRVYTPNIFSPNGDGHNETFGIDVKPNTVRAIRNLRIINRWGTMVYECENCSTGNAGAGWDGNIGGKPAQSALYLWAAEIEFVDGHRKLFTGDVTLIR